MRRGGGSGGGRESIYLSLHCYHQNDSCIKIGSEESRFHVSSIVRDKVTKRCPQTTTQPSQSSRSLYSSGLLLYVVLSSGLLKVMIFFRSSCLCSSSSGLLKVMMFFGSSCLSSSSSGLLKVHDVLLVFLSKQFFFWSSQGHDVLRVFLSKQSKQFF